MKFGIPPQVLAAALRVGVFAFLAIAGLFVFGWFLYGLGYFIAAALHTLLAAVVANGLAMRIFEHSNLTEIGFHWNRAAVRHVLLGVAAGALAGLFVTLGPVLEGSAELVPIVGARADWRQIVFTMVLILFGAVGEEMLFRGYAFQVLMATLGPFATILPFGFLFALAHSGNLNVSPIALINTGLWGVILGLAFWRSGDLWLPIGLHAGWNWVLPLMGANLSGFTMGLTGRELHWNIDPIWSGGAYGPEGGLLTCIALAALFAWLILKAPVHRQTPYLLREQWED
ncbi:MAG TPA: type II CAAX endopeptidase family protein [Bryobacteraceae bacterium]|nr:type II CAAX endopeptidase family protein [Bryobacteraceae bacterium]